MFTTSWANTNARTVFFTLFESEHAYHNQSFTKHMPNTSLLVCSFAHLGIACVAKVNDNVTSQGNMRAYCPQLRPVNVCPASFWSRPKLLHGLIVLVLCTLSGLSIMMLTRLDQLRRLSLLGRFGCTLHITEVLKAELGDTLKLIAHARKIAKTWAMCWLFSDLVKKEK